MADLTHDTADDAFHEIQLSGKQLVFLFMATTVISVIIFICGVLVGRSVPVEGISAAEAPATSVSVPADVPAPTPGASTPPSAAPAAEGTSYSARLDASSTPQEKLAPVPEPPPVSAPAAAEATRPAADAAEASAPEPKTKPPVETPKPAAAQPGTWAVQVVSLRDRGAANQIVQRLQSRNYPAFLVAPSPGTPTQLYKVQVGKYRDRAEAERIQARLKKEEQFDPWIVR